MKSGSAQAAEVVWKWRVDARAEERTLTTARLRRQGLVRGGVGLFVAGLAFVLHWQTIAYVAAAIGTLTLLSALISPIGMYARIERGLEMFGAFVADVVTWIVMIPVFLFVFLPFGLIARRGRNDAMKRYFEREAPTYWAPYREPGPADRPF